jgi:hypothetical protein
MYGLDGYQKKIPDYGGRNSLRNMGHELRINMVDRLRRLYCMQIGVKASNPKSQR